MSEFNPRTTPWQIDESEFYEIEDRTGQLRFLLRYAVLAPSGHNTQPWTFRIVEEGIEVFADFTRRLPVIDPGDRELLMSLGATIANLRVAAAHFGFETSVLYQPRGGSSLPTALVALRETCAPDRGLAALFPAITRRHTNRQPFQEQPLDQTALAAMCDFIDQHADTVSLVVPHDQARVAELVAEGARTLMGREPFRNELADWIRPNEGSAPDGICGDAFGIPGPLAALGPWMVRRLDIGGASASHDRELAEHAAALIVVTGEDDAPSLLRSGEALELLLLLLTSLGIHYSFLNQPIEVDQLRRELWSMLRSLKPPQLLLRIGYGKATVKAMPRRPVEAVVLD